jgi:hypothetical protein
MEKRTVLDHYLVQADGHILIRFCKQIVDDDGTILASEYHRTSVNPDQSVEEIMAMVNTNLEAMGNAKVDLTEVTPIASVKDIACPTEKVAAYQTKVQAQTPPTIAEVKAQQDATK